MLASRLLPPLLGALRDVEGVQGSFVLSRTGQLLAKDLPPALDEALFAVVGPRVVRFYDALASRSEDIKHVVMRFTRHKLQVRPGAGAFICVVCDLETNAAALGMALALAARGLPPELALETSDPATPVALEPTAPATRLSVTLTSATAPEREPDDPSVATTARAPITYRGRRLG